MSQRAPDATTRHRSRGPIIPPAPPPKKLAGLALNERLVRERDRDRARELVRLLALGVAVLLPSVPGAPLMTMGVPGSAVTAWYWRADDAGGRGRHVVVSAMRVVSSSGSSCISCSSCPPIPPTSSSMRPSSSTLAVPDR